MLSAKFHKFRKYSYFEKVGEKKKHDKILFQLIGCLNFGLPILNSILFCRKSNFELNCLKKRWYKNCIFDSETWSLLTFCFASWLCERRHPLGEFVKRWSFWPVTNLELKLWTQLSTSRLVCEYDAWKHRTAFFASPHQIKQHICLG